jgi:hypothetical protein
MRRSRRFVARVVATLAALIWSSKTTKPTRPRLRAARNVWHTGAPAQRGRARMGRRAHRGSSSERSGAHGRRARWGTSAERSGVFGRNVRLAGRGAKSGRPSRGNRECQARSTDVPACGARHARRLRNARSSSFRANPACPLPPRPQCPVEPNVARRAQARPNRHRKSWHDQINADNVASTPATNRRDRRVALQAFWRESPSRTRSPLLQNNSFNFSRKLRLCGCTSSPSSSPSS